MPAAVDVTIIGLGSRGLGVLERLVTLARRRGRHLGVDVVDPTCVGAGVHDPGQPDYLLLNTTCAHVSMFPDEHTVGSDVDEGGPSLYEWVTERGLRLGPDGYSVGSTGRPIRPTDFLPRRVLGEYLAWFGEEVRKRAEGTVDIRLHPTSAVDLAEEAGGRLRVGLADGGPLRADHVFLTTGYTANRGDHTQGRLIRTPYPLPDQLAAVQPGQTVAIAGFGLSAMDVMSCLTVGRGGRFEPDGDALAYRPSGDEPTMLFYSRTGVPCRARPAIMELGPPHEPLSFTPAAIDARRAAAGGPLDFDADILPLVLTEIRLAYRVVQARLAGEPLVLPVDQSTLEATLDELDRRLGRFDPAEALSGAGGLALDDPDAYQAWLMETVERDLAQARRGFAGSEIKSGLDVLRALRDTFRYAIDFGAVTDASLERFHRDHVPAINRAAVGPQYERHAELLALLRSGLAATPFGPAPSLAGTATGWTITSTQLHTPVTRTVDWVVQAHVPPPAAEESASPLLESLHRKGWIRRHPVGSRWVPGLEVDREQHPIDRDGVPRRAITVLGLSLIHI